MAGFSSVVASGYGAARIAKNKPIPKRKRSPDDELDALLGRLAASDEAIRTLTVGTSAQSHSVSIADFAAGCYSAEGGADRTAGVALIDASSDGVGFGCFFARLARALRNNRSLQHLRVWAVSLDAAALQALVIVVRDTAALRSFALSASLSRAGFAALVVAAHDRAAQNNARLGALALHSFTAVGMAEPAAALDFLTALDVSDNHIGDNGFKVLAKALHANKTLVEASANAVGIADGAATDLALALGDNMALRRLHLNSNAIGDAGATALAEALQVNDVLERLALEANLLGNAGAAQLALALSMRSRVDQLLLANNAVGEGGVAALAHVLAHHGVEAHIGARGNAVEWRYCSAASVDRRGRVRSFVEYLGACRRRTPEAWPILESQRRPAETLSDLICLRPCRSPSACRRKSGSHSGELVPSRAALADGACGGALNERCVLARQAALSKADEGRAIVIKAGSVKVDGHGAAFAVRWRKAGSADGSAEVGHADGAARVTSVEPIINGAVLLDDGTEFANPGQVLVATTTIDDARAALLKRRSERVSS